MDLHGWVDEHRVALRLELDRGAVAEQRAPGIEHDAVPVHVAGVADELTAYEPLVRQGVPERVAHATVHSDQAEAALDGAHEGVLLILAERPHGPVGDQQGEPVERVGRLEAFVLSSRVVGNENLAERSARGWRDRSGPTRSRPVAHDVINTSWRGIIESVWRALRCVPNERQGRPSCRSPGRSSP